MSQVYVWNDNSYPYSEKFKGKMVTIPAKECVMMEDDDAVLFLGTLGTFKMGGNGLQDPSTYKRLRIEKTQSANVKSAPTYRCNGCGIEYPNAKALENHAKIEHADALLAEPAPQEEIMKEAPRRGRPKKEIQPTA